MTITFYIKDSYKQWNRHKVCS